MSKSLGWAAVAVIVAWLYFDYKHDIDKAIIAGWISLALIGGHVLMGMHE